MKEWCKGGKRRRGVKCEECNEGMLGRSEVKEWCAGGVWRSGMDEWRGEMMCEELKNEWC